MKNTIVIIGILFLTSCCADGKFAKYRRLTDGTIDVMYVGEMDAKFFKVGDTVREYRSKTPIVLLEMKDQSCW